MENQSMSLPTLHMSTMVGYCKYFAPTEHERIFKYHG